MLNVQVFETPEAVARNAAQFIVALASSISSQRPFRIVLSGGETPRRVYELLASEEFKLKIDWSAVQVFFGDERTVPANDPASNYGMASAALLSKVPIPKADIHPISGAGDPTTNAEAYERELKSVFPSASWPEFDLVLLGMGEDGHIASLFPGTAALKEEKHWVAANWVPRLEEFRITLTLPTINAASNILFLVTGEKKAARLAQVLSRSAEPEQLPAQLVKPSDGSLVWMIDQAAAENTEWRASGSE